METNSNKSKLVSSLLWKLLESTGTQSVQIIVQIMLARLLLPEEFGIIAIVMVFILIANTFVQSGFNTALIQKKDPDEVDFSSAFYLSLGVATLLYTVIFFVAPFVADFYDQHILTQVLRVLSITLFIGAVNSIQNAFVAKYMLFKKLFQSSFGAALISGIVGTVAAYSGLGVWALVAQHLTNQLTLAIILWFTVKWRPNLLFSFERVKKLFSFGSKLLISALIDTLYKELNTLIIGRMYTPSTLGFYNRGQQFPLLIVANINGSIQSVLLPALSAHQDNRNRVKEMMRRAIVTSSFLIFPMMVGMSVVAEPLVKTILTEKWMPSVPFVQIACFTFALWPLHTANLQAINAMGRSDIYLKLEIFKKIIGLIILGVSIPFGIYAIAIGGVISGIISTFINTYPNKKLLDYSYSEQLLDLIPSLFISVVMGVIVNFFKFISFPAWKVLILKAGIGIVIYIVLARMFKIESFYYLVRTMRQFIKVNKSESNS